MVKRLIVLATVLLFVGLIGSAFTIKGKLNQNVSVKRSVDMSDVQHIDITIPNGHVNLYPTEGKEAEMEFVGNLSENNFIEKVENGTLKITVKSKGFGFFSIDLFSLSQTINVAIPEHLYDSITVQSYNGKINVDEAHVTHLDLKTDNGRISLKNVVADTTNVRSSNGKINLAYVTGEVNAHTSNGKISLKTVSLDQSIDLSTNNGAIEILTDQRPENVVIDAKTDNGRIEVYGKRNWDIVTGNGEHVIKLMTDNGSITISDNLE